MRKTRLLKVVGLSESEADKRLRDVLENKSNLSLELITNEIEMKVKIAAWDRDENNAEQMIESLDNKIRERLEDYIFGVDEESLEKVVGVLLTMRKKTIGVAESCTGGLVSHRLTNVPGSSNYFRGSVVAYNNEVKEKILRVPLKTLEQFGAVSRETVRAMAGGIGKVTGSDLGLAITGIAGPGGGREGKPVGEVYVALAAKNDLSTEEHHFTGKRELIKMKTSQVALDMIRRYLLNDTKEIFPIQIGELSNRGAVS
jgi:nicotinamide-nucleotide amidase